MNKKQKKRIPSARITTKDTNKARASSDPKTLREYCIKRDRYIDGAKEGAISDYMALSPMYVCQKWREE